MPPRFHHSAIAACGVCVLAAAAVYWNALHNPFVYDDYRTVVDNPTITNLKNPRGILLYDVTRPLVNLSFAVDRVVWGPTPFGFHVTNLLLHMIAVALLFRLAYDLTDEGNGTLAGFVAAALLAVHPMMTEAVGYISGRSEVLCTCLFLAALICGRRWLAGGGRRWVIATVGLWVAALAAKELIAMFPFVLALCDWLTQPDSESRRRRMLRLHLPLMSAAIAIGLIRLAIFRIEYPDVMQLHWSYGLMELDVVRRYLSMLFNPKDQAVFHEVAAITRGLDSRVLSAAAVVGALLFAAAAVRTSRPVIALGISWFFLALVPPVVLVMLDRGEPMAEHRVYLASCGLFLAAGDGAVRMKAWLDEAAGWLRYVATAALVAVLAAYAVETVVRNAIWSDPIALWHEAVDLAPRHYRPRLLLGEALGDAGRRADAIDQFRIAIQLKPGDATGHLKLGRALAESGRLDEAKQHFRTALAIDPHNGMARQSLAVLDGLSPSRQ